MECIIPQEMECQLAYLTAVSTIDKPKGALRLGDIGTVSRVLDHTFTHPSFCPDQGPVIAYDSDAESFHLTYAPDATSGTLAADAPNVVKKLEVEWRLWKAHMAGSPAMSIAFSPPRPTSPSMFNRSTMGLGVLHRRCSVSWSRSVATSSPPTCPPQTRSDSKRPKRR